MNAISSPHKLLQGSNQNMALRQAALLLTATNRSVFNLHNVTYAQRMHIEFITRNTLIKIVNSSAIHKDNTDNIKFNNFFRVSSQKMKWTKLPVNAICNDMRVSLSADCICNKL